MEGKNSKPNMAVVEDKVVAAPVPVEDVKEAPKVEAKIADGPVQKKLTYDELNNACNQLQQQLYRFNQENKVLKEQLMNVQRAEQLQYLGFAFKVLEHKADFEASFVETICKFITVTLNPEPESQEKAE